MIVAGLNLTVHDDKASYFKNVYLGQGFQILAQMGPDYSLLQRLVPCIMYLAGFMASIHWMPVAYIPFPPPNGHNQKCLQILLNVPGGAKLSILPLKTNGLWDLKKCFFLILFATYSITHKHDYIYLEYLFFYPLERIAKTVHPSLPLFTQRDRAHSLGKKRLK